MHHPATVPGARVRADLVDLVDVVGTVCDWFDWERPPGAVQRSLLAEHDTELPPRAAVVCAYDRVFTVRDEQWRLIWNPLRRRVRGLPDSAAMTPELWLQDLTRDPSAAQNYADAHPEVVARLQGVIKRWREARRPLRHRVAQADLLFASLQKVRLECDEPIRLAQVLMPQVQQVKLLG